MPRAKELGLLALIGALRKNPLEAWTTAYFEEPVVTRRLAFVKAHVVSEPGAIRRVLSDNAANYRKDKLQRRMMPALANGLLMVEGEQWHKQRRTLAPLFMPKTVGTFTDAMAYSADRLVERWRRHDGVRDIAAEVIRLTIDVLERTIFSEGLGHDAEEIRAAMHTFFNASGQVDPLDLLGLPDFIPRPNRLRVRPALRVFNAAIDAMVAARKQRLAQDPANAPRDILTLLIEMKDPQTGSGLSELELRSNIVTFMTAGHETTGDAIIWTLFLLSQSEEWSERVAREANLAAGDRRRRSLERLVETRAVIEEALRLYPSIPAISRVAIAADELAGTRVDPGSLVIVAPYVVHRHRRLWERPDMFDPTRFLNGGGERMNRYAYMPFGGGARGCIGSIFAMQEATLVVATLLGKFTFELAPGATVWPMHSVTLRPRGGLPLMVRARSERVAYSRTG